MRGWWRRRPRRVAPRALSLRARLLALLLALLTAVSAAIVGVTVFVLRGHLIDQVDARLEPMLTRFGASRPPPAGPLPDMVEPGYGGPPNRGGGTGFTSTYQQNLVTDAPAGPAEFLDLRGQPPGSVAAWVRDNQVEDAELLDQGAISALTAQERAPLATVPADGEPTTVGLGGLGEYRVAAVELPDGAVAVAGLPLAEVNATVQRLVIVAGAVAATGVLLLGVVGAVTVRRTLRPLGRVAATAAQVASLPLDRGEVALPVRVPAVDTNPRTEVGQVGAALNHMLGHVAAALAARHASETRVRQFVADASHELRTPLAAISGYAQLGRRMADAVPPDVGHALGRIESEAARMTALVEDLLLLARLDAGRPINDEPVDLSRLVVDAVSDAHVAAPRHRFDLDLPAAPVVVRGDSARLHQVLANLLANARSHTPPGTRVTVRLATTGAGTGPPDGAGPPRDGHGERRRAAGLAAAGADHAGQRREVLLSVSDDGPGIPPALLPHVFERFARGDSSRSRAAGGTGLGLAIVAAVVEAHHGRIAVTSEPGQTTFTVTFPADVGDSTRGGRRDEGRAPTAIGAAARGLRREMAATARGADSQATHSWFPGL
ncbi:MAG: HAMP domain-containing protein [Frankia sp.]|nr:HAMP domain-containing protein [Frankia sp.]